MFKSANRRALNDNEWRSRRVTCATAGFQVATDAAPQLRLAAFTEPYADTTGFPDGWKGVLVPQDMVEQWVGYAYANDIQLFSYSNGDAGIDLSLAAIEKAIAATGKTGDRRTIISHSYFVRPDQLAAQAVVLLLAAVAPVDVARFGQRGDLGDPGDQTRVLHIGGHVQAQPFHQRVVHGDPNHQC